MKNINQKQVAELMALQQAMSQKKKPVKKRKTKRSTKRKTTKKNDSNPFGWVVVIGLMLATGYFLTGCSYHPNCDQTKHGRGNIPASCRGITGGGS